MNIKKLNEEISQIMEGNIEVVIKGNPSAIKPQLIGKLPKGCNVENYFDTVPGPNNNDGVKITCDKEKEYDLIQVLKQLGLKGIKLNESSIMDKVSKLYNEDVEKANKLYNEVKDLSKDELLNIMPMPFGDDDRKYYETKDRKYLIAKYLEDKVGQVGKDHYLYSIKDFANFNEAVNENLDGIDTLTIDIPLMMRLLEFAREDAKQDIDLHFLVENALRLQQNTPILGMDNYEALVSNIEEGITNEI